jgi:hypothetical protein
MIISLRSSPLPHILSSIVTYSDGANGEEGYLNRTGFKRHWLLARPRTHEKRRKVTQSMAYRIRRITAQPIREPNALYSNVIINHLLPGLCAMIVVAKILCPSFTDP